MQTEASCFFAKSNTPAPTPIFNLTLLNLDTLLNFLSVFLPKVNIFSNSVCVKSTSVIPA